MNINSAISNGSKILSKNSILSAQLDSEILMAKTVMKDRNFILLNSDKVLNKNDINSKSKNSPFIDAQLSGKVIHTISKGVIATN